MTVPSRPEILCVMRMPPDLDGHGGSQRAWHLVEALRPHGRVHFVLVFRDQDLDCVDASLASIEPFVASVTRINIEGWRCTPSKPSAVLNPGVWDLFRMRSHEAPRLSGDELRSIAARLPLHRPDIIFAGRLCSAVILQGLLARNLLSTSLKIVDFDDVLSKFRMRQIRSAGRAFGRQWRALAHIDARILSRQERLIANSWHGVSVCTDEDVANLQTVHPHATVVKIPNVVHRDLLPSRVADGRFRILFTGNLSAAPNVHGLKTFVEDCWAALRDEVPGAELVLVGLNPTPAVVALAERHGLPLHSNVPSLRPFYEECDVTIAPILFGSGTRIKILESMAYGRPVVATALGAEGMGLEGGRHLLLAETMADFGSALVSLARNPVLQASLAAQAHAFQQQHFGPPAIRAAVSDLIAGGRLASDRQAQRSA